jgi:hypothetical protein
MANSKWFYNGQSQANDYLHKQYDEVIGCNSQHITKEFVYETYTVVNNLKTIQVMVMLNKRNQVAIYEMQAMFHLQG